MINLNRVMLGGRLVADPVFKYSKDNIALCQFCMAINRKVKNGNLSKDVSSFIAVDCFGSLAENIHKFFKKGKAIFIEGRVQQSRWVDQATGKNRSKLQIIAESFQFVDEVKKENAFPKDNTQKTETETEDSLSPNTDVEEAPVDDELPF